MTTPKDYSGEKHNRLTAIKEVEPYIYPNGKKKRRRYLFQCECGGEVVAPIASVRHGNTKSCGCISREKVIQRNKETAKYKGAINNAHYNRWKGMIERCQYEQHKDYNSYGGRGIKVCDEWKNDPFEFFRWIENESNYEEGFTLDRIDVNGDYEPSNCKFSSLYEQAVNKRVLPSNKTGYPGVGFHGDRYRVRITIEGKRKHLGVYEKLEDAIQARKDAELKYFGKVLHPEL